MNATIVTLVLGAAILHVSWNALPKSGDDRLRSTVVMTGMASLAALPALIVLPRLTRAVWPLVALTAILHNGDNLPLVRACALGDLGPVMAAIYLLLRGWRAPLVAADRETMKSAAGGLVSMLAYGVVIRVASIAPMGRVSALRETSVVFAALIGWLFLGERFRPRRLAACLPVALGAMTLGAYG